jgi:hypothetical protein
MEHLVFLMMEVVAIIFAGLDALVQVEKMLVLLILIVTPAMLHGTEILIVHPDIRIAI